MDTIPIEIAGYPIIEQLYTGSRSQVYRGIQPRNQRSVVVKLLKHEHPSFRELVQFHNQYSLTKNLNLPGIVRSYSLESYRNSYALVMEDFGGISLCQYTQAQALDLVEFFPIALQLVEILHQLHQHRVIHKDIKPANILIHPETKQVKLTDFSIASLLPRETQEIQNPNVLEGTLAYLSPEQTGRMNRGIDYRSDYYALGVTCFELLTGQLPFQTHEPMEMVHCHLARQPPLVCDLNPQLPLILGEIITRLIAKNAEDRYQSAIGIKHDLMRCWQEWQSTGNCTGFELGQRDISDRFLIPEKLYGRETEVQALLAAFDRVAEGASELMLVAGFSGIGKTAVINEVHKPIARGARIANVRQRGYFIKGKFDPFNRNIPFSAFVQAFRDLMEQLLSESDAELQAWKTRILSALGENAQVMIDLIPELEHLIGTQSPVPELSGTAAQNRFNLLFQKFIQVFTTPEHPLVIFIDDLQWVDSASLHLIQMLMAESQTGYLLLLGAYRDNEVLAAHPLRVTLNEMAKAGAILQTITLQPLSLASLNHLIADTLHAPVPIVQPLTELVMQKTQGNPFFATQFLKALHQDQLITFDVNAGHWQCDIVQVRDAALTDDVVEFMALQLQKLPQLTQDILKLAACMGAQFDLATLAIVSQQSQSEVATRLWKALQEGLILPQSDIYKFYLGDNPATQNTQNISHESLSHEPFSYELLSHEPLNYKFLHDRVQQAAYSLIPEIDRAIKHYQIGQLLWQQSSPATREDRIFELVNQLNYGITLITEQTQRDELAQLNLAAGHKARTATAYQVALNYASVGLSLLGTETWQRQYEMTLALHELAAEVAWLCGDWEQMERWIVAVMQCARTPLDRVKANQTKIQALTSRNQMLEAIALGKSVLQNLDVQLPDHPTPEDVQQIRQEIATLIQKREGGDDKQDAIESLVHLPKMTNPQQLAILKIASSITPACFMTGSSLYPLVVALQVQRSIQFGNSPFSAYGYASYAFQLSVQRQDVTLPQQFGQLAYRLATETDAKKIRAATCLLVGGYVYPCTRHLQETLPVLQEGYQAGLETGKPDFAGYNARVLCVNAFWCGEPLVSLERQIHAHYQQLLQLNQIAMATCFTIYWEAIRIVLGQPEDEMLLRRDVDAEDVAARLRSTKDVLQLYHFFLYRLMLNFLLGDVQQAEKDAVQSKQYLAACRGNSTEPIFYFYDSLTALAGLSELSESTANPASALQWQQIQTNQERLRQWAHHAPMNHQHKVDLVEAEKYRVSGKNYEAGDYYDRAIAGARANKYIQEAALSNELAAKFYLNWGKEKVAAGYMQEAYYDYAKWGAKAKVSDLEQRYPQLLVPILQPDRSALFCNETNFVSDSHITATSSSGSLDLAAVLKASQTLSSEIELDRLLTALLHTVMQTAGADKCVLMLQEEEGLMVRAAANLSSSGSIEVEVQPSPVLAQTSHAIPNTLINSVKHSLNPAVIIDATRHPQFIADGYIQTQQPKSLLCSPILHQGKLRGVVYLENNLTTGAFTRDRVELLNLLCAQAAISLENARLYERSQQYAQQLEQSLNELSAAQSRFHNLVNNVPGVVYQYHRTPDGTMSVSYISADCHNLFEITPEQATANIEFFRQRVHPDDLSRFQQAVADAIQGRSSWHWEGRIITPSGIIKWIHGESRIDQRPDGSLVWDGLYLDISERKQAEAVLRQYERMVSLTDNGMALVDRTYTYRLINQTYLNRYQKRQEEIVGHTVSELLGEKTFQSLVKPNLDRCLAGETVHYGEWFDFSENNAPSEWLRQRCFISLIYSPYTESDGTISGAVVNFRDLTDLKQAEDALRQRALQEQAYSRVVQAIRNSLDLDTIFSTATREFAELLQLDVAGMLRYLPEQQCWRSIAEHLRSPASISILGTDIPDRHNPITERLKRGEIVVISDTRLLDDPVNPEVAASLSNQPASWLAFPLTVNGQIWGSIGGAKSPAPVTFTANEIDVARRFAEQLEIAIQQASLYQQVQQLNQELEQRVQERTIDLQKSRDLFEALFQEATDAVLLADPDSGQIWDCNQRAVDFFEATSKAELLGIKAYTLRKVALSEAEVVEIFTFLQGPGVWRQECEYRTLKGGYFWGSLALKTIQVAEQRMILSRILDISDRKQAECQMQRQAEADQLLATIAQTINQSVQFDPILETCLEQIRQFLGCDRLIVRCSESNFKCMIKLEAVARPELSLLGCAFESPDLSPEWFELLHQGEVIVHSDVQSADLSPAFVAFLSRLQVRAKIVVPILQADQLWGLLIVHQCDRPRQWQPVEINLLKQLGLQIGTASQKASLYTQLETQLAQKELLLKEIHHRVKNNLQVVSSMLWLQAQAMNHPSVSKALEDTRHRLQAMSLIHETLYQHGNVGQVSFHDYIQRLANSVLAVYSPQPNHISLHFQLQPVAFTLETAIPCGLLLNELITNAIKHGFVNRQGAVWISLEPAASQASPAESTSPIGASASQVASAASASSTRAVSHYVLTVQDNGVGIPESLEVSALQSLGLKIAYDLALQLEGELALERLETGGTRFRLTFAALEYVKRFETNS